MGVCRRPSSRTFLRRTSAPPPGAKPYSGPDSWTRAIETLRKRQVALGPQRSPAAAARHVSSAFESKDRFTAGRQLKAIAEALGRLGQANGAVALRKLEALDRLRRTANLEPVTSTTLNADRRRQTYLPSNRQRQPSSRHDGGRLPLTQIGRRRSATFVRPSHRDCRIAPTIMTIVGELEPQACLRMCG